MILEGVGPWILAVVVQVEVRTTLAAVLLLVVEKGWVRTWFEASYCHSSLEVEKLNCCAAAATVRGAVVAGIALLSPVIGGKLSASKNAPQIGIGKSGASRFHWSAGNTLASIGIYTGAAHADFCCDPAVVERYVVSMAVVLGAVVSGAVVWGAVDCGRV